MGLVERLRMFFGGRPDVDDEHRQELERRIDAVNQKLEREARLRRLDAQAAVQQRRK